MNRKARIAVLGAVVGGAGAAAVAAFLIARPAGEQRPDRTEVTSTAPAPDRAAGRRRARAAPAGARIVVRNGRPVGGVRKIHVRRGQQVRFTVTSDVGAEVHVHGYDIKGKVRPGSPTSFRFPARIEGVFEIELHPQHVQIGQLRVTP
jgi:FtsP/CotA-like multicopper oxidase with cupredoxin domain